MDVFTNCNRTRGRPCVATIWVHLWMPPKVCSTPWDKTGQAVTSRTRIAAACPVRWPPAGLREACFNACSSPDVVGRNATSEPEGGQDAGAQRGARTEAKRPRTAAGKRSWLQMPRRRASIGWMRTPAPSAARWRRRGRRRRRCPRGGVPTIAAAFSAGTRSRSRRPSAAGGAATPTPPSPFAGSPWLLRRFLDLPLPAASVARRLSVPSALLAPRVTPPPSTLRRPPNTRSAAKKKKWPSGSTDGV